MFFPENIKGIKQGDYVLEIGPGGTPHHRSNVFLEKIFDDENVAKAQRGHTPKIALKGKTIYYSGGAFPFKDKEFDYVICSHVLEHVADIEEFVKELFRVARKGYVEYPLIYYDYVYNITEHINFLKFKDNTLCYLKKCDTNLSDFDRVTEFFYLSLGAGYSQLVDKLKTELFEGFEWSAPFAIKRVWNIDEVCYEEIRSLPPFYKKSSFIKKVLKRPYKMFTSIFNSKSVKRT
ncbi:MAG: class I SAM-dependent methyltransferase [Candidatus Margulisiibacteriota bacterium]